MFLSVCTEAFPNKKGSMTISVEAFGSKKNRQADNLAGMQILLHI